jgi:hypothetical protein
MSGVQDYKISEAGLVSVAEEQDISITLGRIGTSRDEDGLLASRRIARPPMFYLLCLIIDTSDGIETREWTLGSNGVKWFGMVHSAHISPMVLTKISFLVARCVTVLGTARRFVRTRRIPHPEAPAQGS